jgi:plasmid replication initiation protein
MINKAITPFQAVFKNPFFRARYSLDPLEQKFLLLTVSMGMQNPTILKGVVNIPVQLFADKLDISTGTIYKKVKLLANSLTKKNLKIEELNGVKRFVFFSIYGMIEYVDGEGFVRARLNEGLIPYITDFEKGYTKIDLEYLMKLKSGYAIRLYELIKCELRGKKEVRFNIKLQELREILEINEKEYINFNDFDRRVLKTGSKECNEKTDITWKYKAIKTGRKVTHLEIYATCKTAKTESKTTKNTDLIILENEQKETQESNKKNTQNEKYEAVRHLPYPQGKNKDDTQAEIQPPLNPLLSRLQNLGFSSENAYNIFNKNEPEYIEFVFTKSKIETRDKVENKAGYFQSILSTYKQDYLDKLEQDKKEKEQAENFQKNKEAYEQKKKEEEELFNREQPTLSRDILEEYPEIFCKHVYKYLKTFIEINFGYTKHPEYFENEKAGKHDENMKIARAIQQRFLSCTSLRDFRNLIKYDEEWLFSAVFSTPEYFNESDPFYYKNKGIISRVELPFSVV